MKAARRASICSRMSGDINVDTVDPAEDVRGQELVMVGGEMPVEHSALLLLYLRRRRLEVRVHGRPRSDRKRRFLLSAVALSTSTRHPREAKPINWAQRGGLACRPGNCVLTPRPHFTAPSCTLGNRVVGASDGPPFRQERRPTRVCRTPGAGSGLLAEARVHWGRCAAEEDASRRRLRRCLAGRQCRRSRHEPGCKKRELK